MNLKKPWRMGQGIRHDLKDWKKYSLINIL